MLAPPLIPHFSAIAPDYDLLLCDVWGVVHNGVAAFPHACDALMRARAGGAVVVFITNSPRPSEQVGRQLERLQVPRASYDAMVSSGDVTRGVIKERRGQSLCHIGPERDRSLFAGLDVTFAPLESADYAVCSGLYDDETEQPEDYRPRLALMRERKLFMVCGNPDVVVERGDRLVYCAGAIADLYATMGGEVLYAGKPYRPIYDMALAKAENAAGRKFLPDRMLAVGDSIRTDLKGARMLGVDFLFITSGIHAEELGGRERPDGNALSNAFASVGDVPNAVMRRLVW
ncbi:MAG TPA: TIGR01459 family HAD-type hydrolase [Pseudolabrys sp.]|jgi:HAD superfamily hydrolase (TIGR01459 family)|nr:TIGR01459 family HAD-type hydrolase [Pseudolabrys sp.]